MNPTPVWILTSQRSGSSLLAAILNRTSLLKANPTDLPITNPRIMEHYRHLNAKDNYPLFNKLHDHQYVELGLSLEDVVAYYPEIKFLVLKRKNIIAAAVSQYIAEKTGVWELGSSESINAYRQMEPVALNKEELLSAYSRKELSNKFWDDKVKEFDHLFVEYETMLDNLNLIFDYLNLDDAVNQVTVPLTEQKSHRPEYVKFTNWLRANVS